MPSKVASDIQERLAAAHATSGELSRNRSELLRRMRQTLGELRAVRARLQARPGSGKRGDGGGTAGRLARKYHLTPREAEVAMLLAEGAPNLAIAEVLGISEHTARHHTQHVLVKLGLRSRAGAALLIAKELGAAVAPHPRLPKRERVANPA